MEDIFQLKDVLRVLEVPRERFNEWMMKGYISSSVETKRGARVFREYTKSDIYSIAVFKKMIENCSISREVASIASKAWKKNLSENKENLKSGVVFLIADTDKNIKIIPFNPSILHQNTSGLLNKAILKIMGILQDDESDWSYVVVVNIKEVTEKIDFLL